MCLYYLGEKVLKALRKRKIVDTRIKHLLSFAVILGRVSLCVANNYFALAVVLTVQQYIIILLQKELRNSCR